MELWVSDSVAVGAGVALGVGIGDRVGVGIDIGVRVGVVFGIEVAAGIDAGIAIEGEVAVGSPPAQAVNRNAVVKATMKGELKDFRTQGLYCVGPGSQGHP